VRATGLGAAVGAGRLGSIAGPILAGALRARHASAEEVIRYTLPVILIAGIAAIILSFFKAARRPVFKVELDQEAKAILLP